MAGTPSGSDKRVKRGAARPHFLRRRLIISGFVVVLVGVGLFVGLRTWLDSRNERQHAEATEALEKGDYQAGYEKLKAVDAAGGTSTKNGDQGYAYFLELARAAYLAGDSEAAKRYAEEGIKRLPPEDSEAYFSVQMDAHALIELRDGDYRDGLEYQAGMPLAGEER